MTRQEKAIAQFWAVVKEKQAASPKADSEDLLDGINFILAKSPTWAIESLVKMLKGWKP